MCGAGTNYSPAVLSRVNRGSSSGARGRVVADRRRRVRSHHDVGIGRACEAGKGAGGQDSISAGRLSPLSSKRWSAAECRAVQLSPTRECFLPCGGGVCGVAFSILLGMNDLPRV